MKYLGVLLCVYNLLLLPFISSDWYFKYQPIIDACDTPIYFLSVIVFFVYYKRLSLFQKTSFGFAYLTVVFKWIDLNYLKSTHDGYCFLMFVINFFFPLIILHHEKINSKTLRT